MKKYKLQTMGQEGSIKPKKFQIECIGGTSTLLREKEIIGDIWKFIGKATVICIPTNNFVTNGKNVMGAGLAKEALNRYPGIDSCLGEMLISYGFFPFVIKSDRTTHIVNFPVKPDYVIVNKDKSNIVSHVRNRYETGEKIPGFYSIGCLKTIRQSSELLFKVVEIMGCRWKHIIIPKIGTGCGELNWNEVKQILEETGLYQKSNIHFISKE